MLTTSFNATSSLTRCCSPTLTFICYKTHERLCALQTHATTNTYKNRTLEMKDKIEFLTFQVTLQATFQIML